VKDFAELGRLPEVVLLLGFALLLDLEQFSRVFFGFFPGGFFRGVSLESVSWWVRFALFDFGGLGEVEFWSESGE
jgi:hypothetical protein